MSQVIYKITNLVNDKFYVGSTTNKKVRWRQHRTLLRGNRHHCKHLQASWNKYGEVKFDFSVVEEVSDSASLEQAEDRWLVEHVGKPHCYNSGFSSNAPWRNAPAHKTPNFGKVMTAEAKEQISKTLKAFYAEDYVNHPRVGMQHSEATKAKISESKKSNPTAHWSGKERSDETKAKISAAQKGVKKAPRNYTEEGMAKIRAAAEAGHYSHWEGRSHTEEAKEKMSRPLIATLPDRTERVFKSLTEVRDAFNTSIATLIRACKSGNPIAKGVLAGWVLSYQDEKKNVAPVIPEEYKHLPRSRSEAKATGAKQYFTGIPCDRGHISLRVTKGTCIACRREDEKQLRHKE